MDTIKILVRADDSSLLREMVEELKISNIEHIGYEEVAAGDPISFGQIGAIMVALGSAGAFTTFYQVLEKIIERHKNREITLEHGKTKITIKGHSLAEERELIKRLFPEITNQKAPSKKKKIKQ